MAEITKAMPEVKSKFLPDLSLKIYPGNTNTKPGL
jgi:hypothetical protein